MVQKNQFFFGLGLTRAGASKPRINTIKKLSEVLDVSVDELLTCEYITFDKERKDLFAMKNEIIKIAKNKLKVLYGDNPPIRTDKMRTHCMNGSLLATADNLGYSGYNQGRHAYIEVISYNKMLADAKKRNDIFFDKLFSPEIGKIIHIPNEENTEKK